MKKGPGLSPGSEATRKTGRKKKDCSPSEEKKSPFLSEEGEKAL